MEVSYKCLTPSRYGYLKANFGGNNTGSNHCYEIHTLLTVLVKIVLVSTVFYEIHTLSTVLAKNKLRDRIPVERQKEDASKTETRNLGMVCLLVGCFTSQQQASVSQGRICSDNFTCCHTETEVADQTFDLTQSQYTDTGPTSPSADPITPGAWQGSRWSANF